MIGNTRSEINSTGVARRRGLKRRPPQLEETTMAKLTLETNSQSNSQRYRRRDRRIHRCKVVRIQTAPLREIADDIPRLPNIFLAKHCQAMNIPVKEFTSSALDCLTRYSWPGNTRQLENEIKRLIATVIPKVITEDQLNLQSDSARKDTQEERPRPITQRCRQSLRTARMIEEAIRQSTPINKRRPSFWPNRSGVG